jgi:phage terminase large subunit-like protein
MVTVTVNLKRPHQKQIDFIDSPAKRKVVRAGRRSGKTTGVAILAVEQFLAGHRILYATPTQEQVDTFWRETKEALSEPIEAGAFYKNETLHTIERRGSDQRIRAKTAWDADSLRGDFADILILDEFQDMDVEAWTLVGAPMLLDNNGDAIFIYTKKRGRNHTNDLFKRALADETGRWATFIFTSFDNPHISEEALADITDDMTNLGYRMEILAEDIGDDPRALWNRGIIRHVSEIPTLDRVVVGVDPSGAASGDECGIVTVGRGMLDGQRCAFVLGDDSRTDTAAGWGAAVVAAYNRHKAGRVVGEANYGGDMVENTIRTVKGAQNISYKSVRATRGKAVRAEPVTALYEDRPGNPRRVFHVGKFDALEDEMCSWIPGESDWSPGRIDGLVWSITDLMLGPENKLKQEANPFYA